VIAIKPAASPAELHKQDRADNRLQLLAKFQHEVVAHAMTFPTVKYVSYSTCSVHEEENEGVVNSVLQACPHFELVPAVTQWPHRGLPMSGYPPPQTFDLSYVVRTEPGRDHATGMFEALFKRKSGVGTVRVFRQGFELEDPMAFFSGVHCSYRCHHTLCPNTEGLVVDAAGFNSATSDGGVLLGVDGGVLPAAKKQKKKSKKKKSATATDASTSIPTPTPTLSVVLGSGGGSAADEKRRKKKEKAARQKANKAAAAASASATGAAPRTEAHGTDATADGQSDGYSDEEIESERKIGGGANVGSGKAAAAAASGAFSLDADSDSDDLETPDDTAEDPGAASASASESEEEFFEDDEEDLVESDDGDDAPHAGGLTHKQRKVQAKEEEEAKPECQTQ
jgi:hypothetical protein